MLAYRGALEHLTPEELSMGCKEALKVCEFIPKVSEILTGLRVARERIGAYGQSPSSPDDGSPMTQAERDAIGKQIREVGRKLSMPKK